jgi:hypothetical protein
LVARLAKVLVADALLIVAGYFVAVDLQWRSSYAVSEGLAPSTSYLPFVRLFTMAGRAFPLQSPPTLDWLQTLVAAFIVLNLWYVFTALRKGGDRESQPSGK